MDMKVLNRVGEEVEEEALGEKGDVVSEERRRKLCFCADFPGLSISAVFAGGSDVSSCLAITFKPGL